MLGAALIRQGLASDLHTISGGNFVVLRMSPRREVSNWARAVQRVWENCAGADIHPDVWIPSSSLPAAQSSMHFDVTRAMLGRELDDFTDRIERRSACPKHRASPGLESSKNRSKRATRKTVWLRSRWCRLRSAVFWEPQHDVPVGTVNAGGRDLALEQSGEFRTLADIDGCVHNGHQRYADLSARPRKRPSRVSASGALPFLLPVARSERRVAAWPRHHTVDGDEERRANRSLRDSRRRSCRSDPSLPSVRPRHRHDVRPETSRCARSSTSSIEASGRRWRWSCSCRSSGSGNGDLLLMALSIPITLAMTFGLMELVGLDIQQMSIASLIIALGLLVDDPVVAGDAIKRELAQKSIDCGLARPRQALEGDSIRHHHQHRGVSAVPPAQGRRRRYIYSLPVTIACSLIASRVMSMTFLPCWRIILKPDAGSAEQLRETRFGAWAPACRRRRDRSSVEGAGRLFARARRRRVFRDPPSSAVLSQDDFYLAYVDVRLPEDRPWLRLCASPGSRPGHSRRRRAVRPIASTAGGRRFCSRIGHVVRRCSGPRFWFSVRPEPPAPNYAQLLLQFTRSEDTNQIVGALQKRSPRASLARESTSARLKPDRRH